MGSIQYTPDLRRPRGPVLRQCWGADLKVGREELGKALEKSLTI